MGTPKDQLLMEIKTVQDIGSTIITETKDLRSLLQNDWQKQFDTLYNRQEGGKGSLGNNLPACLQSDFENYESKQKSDLEDILHEREQIGTLLTQSSDLMDFQDKTIQQSFNIYSDVSKYYNDPTDKTNPTNLQQPQGFEFSPTNIYNP